MEENQLWHRDPLNTVSLSVFEMIFDFVDLSNNIDEMLKRNEMWLKKGKPMNEDGSYPSLEDLEQFSD
jgi:hypothetical protein